MGIQSLIIKDENFGGGGVINEFILSFENPSVSAADIIRERIRYEIESYKRKSKERFLGLVQPIGAEVELNGYKLKKGRKIDVNKQIETALKAFKGNGFFMLVDDRQVETLDEVIKIRPNMDVVFLKLTPLVGG